MLAMYEHDDPLSFVFSRWPMEKIPKFNKRRAFIKDVGPGKNPKLINVGPTFIPDYRVPHILEAGLDRTGYMNFLTRQDRTPKFAGPVLPDRTKSGLIFLNILHYKY